MGDRSRSRDRRRRSKSRERRRSRSRDRRRRSRSRSADHKHKKSKKSKRERSGDRKDDKKIARDYDEEEEGFENRTEEGSGRVKEEKLEAVDMEISNSP